MNLTLPSTILVLGDKVMSAGNQQERPTRARLDPWYITGFVEGEGTFYVACYSDAKMKTGIKVIPELHISRSHLRREALEAIRNYFHCGYLKPNHKRNPKDTTWVLVVRNRDDLLTKIIPFFERYPFLSRKRESFQTFAQIVRLMNNGVHRTATGATKILRLAQSMNGGGIYRWKYKNRLEHALESSETVRQKNRSQK